MPEPLNVIPIAPRSHALTLTPSTTDRINIIRSNFTGALRNLPPGYDLPFFDGYAPSIAEFHKVWSLLRPRGVLVSANLDLPRGHAVRAALADRRRRLTAPMLEDGKTNVSIAIEQVDGSCTS